MENNFHNFAYAKKLEILKQQFKGTLKNNSDAFIDELIWLVDMGNDINFDPNKRNRPTIRQEANVITAFCFRNTILEDIHAKSIPFNDDTMKKLMIESSSRLSEWLSMRDMYNDTRNLDRQAG